MEQVVDAVMQNPAYAEGGLEFRHGELLEMLRLDAGGFVRRFGKYMGMVQMRAVEVGCGDYLRGLDWRCVVLNFFPFFFFLVGRVREKRGCEGGIEEGKACSYDGG